MSVYNYYYFPIVHIIIITVIPVIKHVVMLFMTLAIDIIRHPCPTVVMKYPTIPGPVCLQPVVVSCRPATAVRPAPLLQVSVPIDLQHS